MSNELDLVTVVNLLLEKFFEVEVVVGKDGVIAKAKDKAAGKEAKIYVLNEKLGNCLVREVCRIAYPQYGVKSGQEGVKVRKTEWGDQVQPLGDKLEGG